MLASCRMMGFVVTTDYDKARAFYEGRLGFEFVSVDEFAMVVRAGENMIRIVKLADFTPFPGFAPDPYEDYSQPWFGSRKVLRGGCWATSERIARPTYRNFFPPGRNDIFGGFRTCAL